MTTPSRILLGVAALAASLAAPAFAADEGVLVARDPQTGELRAATPAEAQQLQEQAALRNARGLLSGRLAPRPQRHPNGMISVELTPAQMSYSVVTRGADGALQMHCAGTAAEAQRLASGQRAAFAKNIVERAHDTQ